ncbi:MAG: tRNA (adenosine(37)-N6)-threonylcarbamoyltransferase complex ATPase subunit type 1 TsaE, partial [Oscillospiraceae bacterium]
MIKKTTYSETETENFAKEIAKLLKPKDVLCFTGGLGVGKTAFCRGLAVGLGCTDTVSSPTFAIVNLYSGKQKLAHFDMYRVNTEEDMYTSGFFDYIDEGAILAVEWSENIIEFLDEPYIKIDIKRIDENTREIIIDG